jgi:hypothetical protein
MGWSVDFEIKKMTLFLVYDRGSLTVVKDPNGEEKTLCPQEKPWTVVSMEDLANEINKEFA